MSRIKVVADEYNAFRKAYNRWGRPQKLIIREEWRRVFNPDSVRDTFDRRVNGYINPPDAEVEWIKGFNPLTHVPAEAQPEAV